MTLITTTLLTDVDHTIDGGYHRAERHLTDEEIKTYITSGEWRMRICQVGLLSPDSAW